MATGGWRRGPTSAAGRAIKIPIRPRARAWPRHSDKGATVSARLSSAQREDKSPEHVVGLAQCWPRFRLARLTAAMIAPPQSSSGAIIMWPANLGPQLGRTDGQRASPFQTNKLESAFHCDITRLGEPQSSRAAPVKLGPPKPDNN